MCLIFWEGANFKLKIKKVAGFWNYDSSEFDSVSALSSDDTELEAIWNKEHSLEAFVAKDQFKSYEELQNRLNLVLGLNKRPLLLLLLIAKSMNQLLHHQHSLLLDRR